MVEISQLIFYRSGEVVRDMGLIYLDSIVTEMNTRGYKVKSNLRTNYLEILEFDNEEFLRYLLDVKIFNVFLNGVKSELRKKIDISLLANVNIDNFREEIDKIIDDNKTKKEIKNKYDSKYFPYMRNSPKYGSNSHGEEHFHNNIKKLINMVEELNLKEKKEQIEVLKDYEAKDRICSVCHTYLTTKYDIHEKQEKERKNSKYNYSFMGSEHNTFNNYASLNASVCFVCEFLNLMYLLYMSLEKPSVLAHIDDLKVMKFLNYKLLVSIENLNEKGFYRKLAQYRNRKARLYEITRDSNKGIIMNLNGILESKNIIRNIKLNDLIDTFAFSKDDAVKKKLSKGFIACNNIESLKGLLIKELFFIDDKNEKRILDAWKSRINIKMYLEILNIVYGEGKDLNINESDNAKNNNEFGKLGFVLGGKINQDNKKTIMFKLNQMLKSDDRTGIFQMIIHLITVNEIKIPKNFADEIINGNEYKLHYNIGRFMESFLVDKKED